MAVMEAAGRRTAMRGLPGATVLQILPALDETPAARAAVDVAVALLRSGARVIVASEDGPLNSELHGIGASRSAAALKKRAGVWLVHSYASTDLRRTSRDKSYSRALLGGDCVIVP